MPVAAALGTFTAVSAQCDSLIANAHQSNTTGTLIFSAIDRKQITVAVFLNLFIGWESFLEEIFAALLCGAPTLNGNPTVKFANPPNLAAANKMIIGPNRYFDYGNHDYFRKAANIYFDQGAPFEPHIAAIFSQLGDIRTMRNSSAHLSSTTQTALEALALRLLNRPSIGIGLYDLLTAPDPNAAGATIYQTYRDTLLTTAGLIANG